MTTFLLSWPVSTNNLWRAYRGRNILSAKARAWADSAAKELISQGVRPISGQVEIDIELRAPHERPYDPDNRVKAVFDLLVKNGIIEADSNRILRRFSVSVGEGFVGAKVTIRKVNGRE